MNFSFSKKRYVTSRRLFAGKAILITILLLYWLSRLMNLTLLPVFVDEAIMLRDAQNLSTWPTPSEQLPRNSKWFHIWLLHLLFSPGTRNVLWLGRFLSVVVGLLACLGCYRLGRQVAGKSVGFLAAAIYVLAPFALWNDRLIAADPLSGTLFLWSWIIVLNLVCDPHFKVRNSLLGGLLMGLSSLTKAINLMVLSIPIICLLLYRKSMHIQRSIRWIALIYLIALLLSSPVLIYLPQQTTIVERHSVTGMPLNVIIEQWLQNVQDVIVWLLSYWGYVGFFLLLVGFTYSILCPSRRGFLLSISVIGPLFTLIVIARNWFPRYLTLIAGGSYIMIGWIIVQGARFVQSASHEAKIQPWLRKVMVLGGIVLLLVMIGQWASFNWWIVMGPPRAPLPEVDRFQYVQGWPAGYGVPEASAFLLQQLNCEPSSNIHVVRNYLLDPLFPGLEVYLDHERSIALHTLDLSQPDSLSCIAELAKEASTFIVLNHPRVPFPFDDNYGDCADMVAVYPKPGGRSAIQIWRFRLNMVSNEEFLLCDQRSDRSIVSYGCVSFQ